MANRYGCARRAAYTALAVTALAACASAPSAPDARGPSSATVPPASAATRTPGGPVPQVRTGPACPDPADREFRRLLGDRVVTGLVRGTGRRVVVLSHQSRGTVCDLAGLAHVLADAGFRVVAWDAGIWTGQETLARLVADERRRGARSVALVGASAGGATSIGAASIITPPVDAVVALSPSGQSEMFGDVVPAAARYPGRLMVVTGELDSAFAGLVPELAAAHSGEELITVLPGVSEHGKSLVVGPDEPSTASVLRFLQR